MPISYAKRKFCQGCGVPNMRMRRSLHHCGFRACTTCRQNGVCCAKAKEHAERMRKLYDS